MDRTEIERIFKEAPLKERKKLGRAKIIRQHFVDIAQRKLDTVQARMDALPSFQEAKSEELDAARSSLNDINADLKTEEDKEKKLKLVEQASGQKTAIKRTTREIKELDAELKATPGLIKTAERDVEATRSKSYAECCSAKIQGRRALRVARRTAVEKARAQSA